MPLELKSHEKVDTHVKAVKHKLERQDMEYLQCLYFDFHLPAIEESDTPETWQCDIPACMSEELDRMITENYVSLNQTNPTESLAGSKLTISTDGRKGSQSTNFWFHSTQFCLKLLQTFEQVHGMTRKCLWLVLNLN